MRKILTVSVITLFSLVSCIKKDTKCGYSGSTIVAPAAEIQTLQDSLTYYGITATQHPSGFFYTINSQGTGKEIANLCTSLSIRYKGGFLNGNVFDSTAAGTTANLQLSDVIPGWQKGVPLISQGGDITLYIPPSLAYGSTDVKDQYDSVVIPGNSYLVFTVHLVAVE
jgi:FKBP-type peptidyl-prolyl cis-trans isomerase FkpA